MQLKTAVQITIGAVGYIAWAAMAALDPTLRADFLRFNIAMAMGTIGLVLRDMAPSAPAAPSGNIPATYREGGAPVDKQAGNAHVGLLALMGLTGALLMAGCATNPAGLTPTQSAQVTFTQGCAAWGATFAAAVPLRQAGKLNRAQIDQITLLDSQITPLCTGPMPTDATAATQQVTAAVTTLAIIEAIKETK